MVLDDTLHRINEKRLFGKAPQNLKKITQFYIKPAVFTWRCKGIVEIFFAE